MSGPGENQTDAARDQRAAAFRAWHRRAVPDVGFAPLDHAEMEQFMSTDPSPEEVRAWLRQQIARHIESENALAELEHDGL